MQIETMAKGKMFTMRMTEQESAQLEQIAQSYGMTSAGLVRMLVQREAAKAPLVSDSDPMKSRSESRVEMCTDILKAIRAEVDDVDGAPKDDLIRWLNGIGYDNRAPIWKLLDKFLSELRHAGYVEKRRGTYHLTAKGEAAAK